MRPPFRFLYVFLAAALTYGALAAFRVPRFDGPHRGWVYGHEHGFRGHDGCGDGCGGYNDRRDRAERPGDPAQHATPPPPVGE